MIKDNIVIFWLEDCGYLLLFYLALKIAILIRITLIFILSLFAILDTRSQDTYYYGVNSRRVDNKEDALIIKEVTRKSAKKYVIRTFQSRDGEWKPGPGQKCRIRGENRLLIYEKSPGRLFPQKVYRQIELVGPELYSFTDATQDQPLRKGTTSSYLPLHLEGVITEYHPNGVVKSISQYKNNQLVSNQNWLSDGSPYIDSVFYSADKEPEYIMGDRFFRNYLVQNLEKSQIDLSQIEDRVVIGWVVMETGKVSGVIALEGKSKQLNQFLVQTIAGLPGDWQPAELDGKPVRYFMSIPFNFIHKEATFQEMDLTDGMLYWNSY
jgi:hypothetical protein